MATYKIDNVVLRIQNNKLVASVDYSIYPGVYNPVAGSGTKGTTVVEIKDIITVTRDPDTSYITKVETVDPSIITKENIDTAIKTALEAIVTDYTAREEISSVYVKYGAASLPYEKSVPFVDAPIF